MVSFGRLPGVGVSMGEREEAWARDSEAAYFQEDPPLEDPGNPQYEFGRDEPGYHIDDDVWVTADGDEIPYTELSHGHLASIVKMIRRELLQVHTGMWPQGEMAQDALESAIDQREDELTQLEAEQERRREVAFP